jgi:hypothetical protein
LWNSELGRLACPEFGDKVSVKNVVGRLQFLSATRCDMSAELDFIASHFYDFLRRPDALKRLPFSLIYVIISQGSLKLDSENSLYYFISKGTEKNWEMLILLESVGFEDCSADVINDLLWLFSEHFYEINASIWTSLCAACASRQNRAHVSSVGEQRNLVPVF